MKTHAGLPTARPRRRSPTARPARSDREAFRITHPYHPLAGREFEQVTHRQNWGEELVYFHDENGRLRGVPLGWTSIASPDPFVVVAAGRSFFRPTDLLELARLVTLWKR